MGKDGEFMSRSEALLQVERALRRLALLYHFFAKTLAEELGEKRGAVLTRKAIDAYGTHIGHRARRRAEELGLPLTPENFESDLPDLAWQTESVVIDGEQRVRVHHCPLAAEWIELGEAKTGRLYCFVDQAKMRGFNPDFDYLHLRNILEGDPYCELVVRPSRKTDSGEKRGEE
ncbi:MAG: L-2-amino-thiazoline-4-carboxylic acid hydrolase [Deltaproteobacteria bacterium]|nr:L-2-amino-thiazoline-4-carboxylic acid hydrolase [Deltaproteobacteria bacterium]